MPDFQKYLVFIHYKALLHLSKPMKDHYLTEFNCRHHLVLTSVNSIKLSFCEELRTDNHVISSVRGSLGKSWNSYIES